jgi:uncharacterized membrane protein YqjE
MDSGVRRWLLRGASVLLAAFAVYSVVALTLTVALDRATHFRVVAQVLGTVLVLAVAVLAAWLAVRAWRRAKSN